MTIALLAGGPRDIYLELAKKLQKLDIDLKYHWQYKRDRDWQKTIPEDVDIVIALYDMMSHCNSHALDLAVEKRSLRIVAGSRKMSILKQRIQEPPREGANNADRT